MKNYFPYSVCLSRKCHIYDFFMLRLLVSSLLLTNLRRASACYSNFTLLNRGLGTTYRNLSYPANNMEEPFEKMAKEGVPKCDEPTEVAAPKKEEQDLPKLSSKEFAVYNRMAAHMDMFVSLRDTLYCSC